MAFYGSNPDEATYYARAGKYEMVVWEPPPPPGDKLCLGLTGRTENQLVRDILDGKFNHIFDRMEVGA